MRQFFYEHRLRETGVSEVMAELPPAEIHHIFIRTNRTFKTLHESTTQCVVATPKAHQ